MHYSANLSDTLLASNGRSYGGEMRTGLRCDKVLLLALALTLSRTVDASATDEFSLSGSGKLDSGLGLQRSPMTTPQFVTPPSLAPGQFSMLDLPAAPEFPEQDFRPRGHSIYERPTTAGTSDEAPMMHGTTVWQRLADFRAHGRVRLLTLWENGGSSISLQAGKKGEPSLQWTSRSMNRGGATRGVLDQLMSVSVAGASRLHMAPHPLSPTTPEPGGHSIKTSESSLGANK